MGSTYVSNLILRVIEESESKNWEEAVMEWEIEDCDEDETCSTSCICGKENLKYLFTIRNKINDNELFPIGSTCIKKFERQDLDEETSLYEGMFRLLHAVENDEFLSLSPKLFSRKLLFNLYKEGAFKPNRFNDFDGKNDYEFLLKMFNKRDKSSITSKQKGKITAVLLNSIKPFLEAKLTDKSLNWEG